MKICMGSPVGPSILAQVRRQGCLPRSSGLWQEACSADCLRGRRPSTEVHLTVPRIPQSNTSKKERMTCLEECVLFHNSVNLESDFGYYGTFCPSHLLFQDTFDLHFAMLPNKARHNLSHADKYLCNGKKVACAPRSLRIPSGWGHRTSNLKKKTMHVKHQSEQLLRLQINLWRRA